MDVTDRRLLSVGYEIPGFSSSCMTFRSDRSLLDADVVLFYPTLRDFHFSTYYQGKRRISDGDSSSAVEHCRRWRQEITEFLKSGKTVIVFLSPYEEVYVHLGETRVSGTGRNAQVTYIVQSLNNYSALPFDLGTIVPKGGSEIRTVGDLRGLAAYWVTFGPSSSYKIYAKHPTGTPILTAKSEEAVVGLLIKSGKGTAVLLPPVEFDEEKFTSRSKKGEEVWNKEGVAFGTQMVNAFLELDRSLRADAEITPAPNWVRGPEYSIASEEAFEQEALAREKDIKRLRVERDSFREKAAQAACLRDLLFEGGKQLEHAVVRALRSMGFSATSYRKDGSEIDAVFSAPEGRFIGEVEGKNDKAVSVEKMDQLERNIREDFARQEHNGYAKGVLFGNAYRLKPINERSEFFTAKCHAAASRGKVALVRTPDLFPIARYLEHNKDDSFAATCRLAILQAEGVVVVFPSVPETGG